MFTPEIDSFINEVTQTNAPVYNQKNWLNSVAGGTGQIITMPIDQQQNIICIVITNLIFNLTGLGGTVNLKDVLLFNSTIISFTDNSQRSFNSDEFNYMVKGENFVLQTDNVNNPFSVGYIRISQKT